MVLPTNRKPLTDADCMALLTAGEPGMLTKIKYVIIRQGKPTVHVWDDILALYKSGNLVDGDEIYELGRQVRLKVSIEAVPEKTYRSIDKDKFYDI